MLPMFYLDQFNYKVYDSKIQREVSGLRYKLGSYQHINDTAHRKEQDHLRKEFGAEQEERPESKSERHQY